jgi:hypothetical protein
MTSQRGLICFAYTVKKIYRIPVFFFTKPFRNGKTPLLTRDFLVTSREGIFCLLRREKYSSLCRGNFFLSVECYISLFPLFLYIAGTGIQKMKILGCGVAKSKCCLAKWGVAQLSGV